MRTGDVATGRFEVVRSAGSGGMGVVYQARDLTNDRFVALKVLLDSEGGLAARFAHEAEVLSTLEHPHIIGYVSHGVTADGSPYLVMPWLEGRDLQERIRERALSVEETITVARCVADALACLHDRGLVHRDLKPSNLFLPAGKLEELKVIDFGIARGTLASSSLTLSGALVGTPGFIAPEQAYGAREVAPAVDVFALGCVLFECLTGRRLFSGAHVMAVLAKILLEEAPRVRELRPDVPEALERLIERMVSKEPELRPQNGTDLLRLIEDLHRIPPGSLRSPVSVGLTASEQRVVMVLVVVLPSARARASILPPNDITRVESIPLHEFSARFGVEIHALSEGTAIALAPRDLPAADGANLLARFGTFVDETFPGSHLALASGSALTDRRLPVGEAIDRGIAMVRALRLAAVSGVQIDEISAALLTSRFDIRKDGARLFLEAERLSLDPTRPLLGRPTSCVGRDRELTILDATFAECIEENAPRVVLITAASGVGKSRVRHEFVRRLATTNNAARTLHCQGDPLHVATPYAQIVQVVREMIDQRVPDASASLHERIRTLVGKLIAPEDVRRVTDFVGELLGVSFEDDEHLALRAARHNETAMTDQIRLAVEDLLRAWCKEAPLVLVMEDLHWADAMSVQIIDGALRRLSSSPLFVVALARVEVHERYPSLWSNRHLTEIRLAPLSQAASRKLVHEVMGENASTNEAAMARMVGRSEGNAFYLEELIRAATERARRTSSIPPPTQQEGLPETIIAVAQARLERLEPEVRKVLRAASVFGDSFWLEGVCALVGDPPSVILPILEALLDHEAIVFCDRSRFDGSREMAFRHTMLRGAAYATLTTDDRALGHRLAAGWLEGVDEDREVVALHWVDGGDRKRAAHAFGAAGDTRLGRAQADAAARCALRALLVSDEQMDMDPNVVLGFLRVLTEGLEAARRIDAREVLAGLEAHVALPADARSPRAGQIIVQKAIESALVLVQGGSTAVIASACAWAAVSFGALSDFDTAKAFLHRGTELVQSDESSGRPLRYAAAKLAYWEGEWGAVVDNLTTTMLPVATRERVAMLLILATAIVSVDGREALDRGLEFVARAETLVESSSEDPVARVNCAKARLLCFYFAGDDARAAEASEIGIRLARDAGLRFEEGLHLHNLGDLYLRLGERAKARAALVASNVIAQDLGSERIHFQNEIVISYLDEDNAHLTALSDASAANNKPWRELHARYWLGRLLMVQGDPDARAQLERAMSLAQEIQVRAVADDCRQRIASLDKSQAGLSPEPS